MATKQKEIVMSKNKKRIVQNQLLIKKVCFLVGYFSNFRGFYLMKGEQNERID